RAPPGTMSPGRPGWRNWSDARRSKRRGLRAMWVRVPPRVLRRAPDGSAASAPRANLDGGAHPGMDHALEPHDPRVQVAHEHGAVAGDRARVVERVEVRALDAARDRLAVVE